MSAPGIEELLSEKQRRVMDRALAEESSRRRHLVVALSGAHAYGFPSPDSDLDLKAIHVEPTEKLLGFGAAPMAADRLEVIDGVEIDYTSNELKPVLHGVLAGNGNYLERILGPVQPVVSPELEELRPLVKSSLSKRLHRHYLGFATGQLKAFEADSPGSAKKVLYVLRTALTGAHALRCGEIVTDLNDLVDDFGLGEARELIVAKRAGEVSRLSPEMSARWSARAREAFVALEAALASSPLPDEPRGSGDLEAWLVALRRRGL